MQIRRISAQQLREWLHDGNEIAVLDVSDGGPYSRAHILAASNMPLANIEVQAPLLLPNRKTRIVICDENESMSVSAAEILTENDFSNIYVLEGGIQHGRNVDIYSFREMELFLKPLESK